MQEWLMTITLGIIGVFLIAVTYTALYQSQKSKKHISGFPFFGGFILAVAFLFSPIKWLAFLGFIDYGLWLLPYVLIIITTKNSKRYICSRILNNASVMNQKNYVSEFLKEMKNGYSRILRI